MHETQAAARSFAATIFCAVLGLFVASQPGCSKQQTVVERGIRDQVLYRSLSADLTDIDPHLVTGLPGINVSATLFEGLVDEDPVDLHPVPGVAESWEISPDGLTYLFHLRASARWSNGASVTAQDFVASARRVLTRGLGASNASLLFPVQNAEAYFRGTLTEFNQVGLSADDARTLRIRLEHPVPSFLSQLSLPAWFPVYLPAVEKSGSANARDNPWTLPENFVGNGPFTLKEWHHGSLILVEKSPTYWDAATVRLHAIHFVPAASVDAEERAFRAGQLHITEALPLGKIDTYRHAQNPGLQISPFLDTYFYRLNVTRPVLNEPKVRRALSLAVNRRAIVETILRGQQQPARSFTPPNCNPAYAPPALALDDPEAGRALLKEAGYPGGQGLPPFELLINISGNHQLIAEAIQAMWQRELGVETHIVAMEQSSVLEQRSVLGYQILRSDWSADYVDDPLAFLQVFQSESSDNHTGWKNPAYDSLLAQAERSGDPTERLALLRRAESILLEDAPLIPIYHLTTIRLVHPAVRGWHPTLLDHHPYKYVWLEP
jgi:oligopeptide transport system substrate-binding protein